MQMVPEPERHSRFLRRKPDGRDIAALVSGFGWWLLLRKMPCEAWGPDDVNHRYRYWPLNDME